MTTQHFKIKTGTKYYEAVQKHFNMRHNWSGVYAALSKLLGEEITQLARSAEVLQVNYAELKNEENKSIFKKDGTLKLSSKKAKKIKEEYKNIIKDAGLEEYEDLGMLGFVYGVMGMGGEVLKRFNTSEHELYYEASFDLEKRSRGTVVPITAVEYHEKYIEELKKQRVREE